MSIIKKCKLFKIRKRKKKTDYLEIDDRGLPKSIVNEINSILTKNR